MKAQDLPPELLRVIQRRERIWDRFVRRMWLEQLRRERAMRRGW
jgi:hypothetical protein